MPTFRVNKAPKEAKFVMAERSVVALFAASDNVSVTTLALVVVADDAVGAKNELVAVNKKSVV